MNRLPLVSVIIPAFNEQAFIENCLYSLTRQETKFPYEILVVDNNSDDKTIEVAKKFNVRILSETKKGPSSARNTGARMANGKILVFLDADCAVPTDHLENIVNTFNKRDIDVLAGPYTFNDGGPVIEWLTGRTNYFFWYYKTIKFLYGIQGFGSGNFAIIKDKFINSHGFNEHLSEVSQVEDLEYAIRLHKKGSEIFYDPHLKIQSSFRRIKKHPISMSLPRFLTTHKYLIFYFLPTGLFN